MKLEVNMLLSLKSDFIDYYDNKFDTVERIPHIALHRISRRLTRDSALEYLSRNKDSLLFNKVVPHGKVTVFDNSTLVVYTDICAANGAGIEKMDSNKAQILHPDKYASLFLDPGGKSVKHIVVGTKNFLVEWKSRNNWKSDVGDTNNKVIRIWEAEYHREFPMYSITYVEHQKEKIAVRLNLAPRLQTLERYLKQEQVIKELKGFYSDNTRSSSGDNPL